MDRDIGKGHSNSIHCLICGEARGVRKRLVARDWRLGTTSQTFQVLECAACEVGFTWPRFSREEQDKYYPEGFYAVENVLGRLSSLLQEVINGRRARLAGKLLQKSDISILDVGCGRGDFLRYVSRLGWHPVGIEPSSASIGCANGILFHYLGFSIRQCFLEEAQFQDGSFDAISLWHVVEHADEPLQLLEETCRVLNRSGLLMIAVPNFSSIESRLCGKYWLGLDVPRHRYHFSERSIRRLVEQAGFRVEVQRSCLLDSPLSLWHSTVYALQARNLPSTLITTLVALYSPLLLLGTLLLRILGLFMAGGTIELYCRRASI